MKYKKTKNKGMTFPELVLAVLMLAAFTGVTVMVTEFTARFFQPLNEEAKEEYITSENARGEPFYITVGFDFGTSSTKIVVNAPYGDGRSFAFLVPEFFQMNDHPHLWKCVLFQNQSTNTFSLAPTINSQQIKNLKTSIFIKF